MVQIVTYNPAWPEKHQHLRDQLRCVVDAAQYAHIGSTSVPGLAAKAIIDIMIGVDDLAAFDASDANAHIQALGYTYKPQHEELMPFRRYFVLMGDNPDEARGHIAHVHLVQIDSAFWRDHLAFRDYLRAHPAERDAYAALKYTLVAQGLSAPDYTNAKTDFVQRILAKATSA
jgi:GrpB-like predicted nucleotidyltransferase (UPF0157 family)